jgi:hypothetical protein
VNLLGEPAAREYLDGQLSVHGRQVERTGPDLITLAELRLQEFLGANCFDRVSDQVAQIFDDACVTMVPLEWEPSGRRSQRLRPVEASRTRIFTRRIVFSWGAMLILDDASPERQLLLTTRGVAPQAYPPQVGERPVVNMGFVGNQALTLKWILTHCDTKDGCSSKKPSRCLCGMRPVVTKQGDDAWECLCDKHSSA